MSRARDYRRGKDGRAVDRFAKRRQRFKPMLAALGLDRAFAKLPRWAQQQFWAAKFPDPAVVAEGPDVPAEAVEAVTRSIAESTWPIPRPDGVGLIRLPSRDFLSVLRTMNALCTNTPVNAVQPVLGAFITLARPILRAAVDQNMNEAVSDMLWQANWLMVRYGRADARALGMRLVQGENDAGKPFIAAHLTAAAPERVRATWGGRDPRPAYRVGYAGGLDGTCWVSWPAREMGIGPEESLPVYVQAHALRHLHERLDIPDGAPWTEWYLGASLAAPKVVDRLPDGDLLVEFRMDADRCGYLVVGRADCGLVVRTFLFLTMTGTPEGNRLYKRLRLTRDEAAWLRLHRLSSFTDTDLREDADLVKILDACGCGHLVAVNGDRTPWFARSPGFAADLRRFVGMRPAPVRSLTDEADDLAGDAADDDGLLSEAA